MSRRSSVPPQLKGFTFVRELGSGGFSDVYLYDQALPKRRVAVKVLLTQGLTAASQAAFVAEANLMAQLSHPYIVKIYHADVSDDGRPYLIMEYLAGRTLSEQYKLQPLSVVDALRTGIRLSGAIATAHAAGVLHRDIKPANVLTNDYGWPALTDFGIASALEDDLPALTTTRIPSSDSGATTGNQSVGMSVPWSPPEMFDDDPKPDIRSDVFSLAATVYTVLAGRTPFEVAGRPNQALDLISRIERGAITPMERTDVPASLLAVLRKGMATDRDARFATAVDFARALQRVELELSYSPTPIEVPNLHVPEPVRPADGAPEDATRARGVTTVAAQAPLVALPPRAPLSPPQSTPIQPTPNSYVAPEATVMRGAPAEGTVHRESGAVSAAVGGTAAPKGKIGLFVGIGAAAVVLVVGGILLASNIGPTPQTPQAEQSEAPSDGNSSPVTEAVPTPVLVSAGFTQDGATAQFVWSNPGGAADDTFVWQRTDGANEGTRTPTSDTLVDIPGIAAGTTVCIDIYVRRGGQLSPEPLAACAP